MMYEKDCKINRAPFRSEKEKKKLLQASALQW